MIKISDDMLLKIALSFSLLGVLVLFIIAQTFDLTASQLNDLDSIEQDSTIKVEGTVKDISDLEKVVFITVENKCETKLVLFKKSGQDEKIGLNFGDRIAAQGKLSEYEGKKEILVEQLEKTN